MDGGRRFVFLLGCGARLGFALPLSTDGGGKSSPHARQYRSLNTSSHSSLSNALLLIPCSTFRQNDFLQILDRQWPLVERAIVELLQREAAAFCSLIFLAQ